MAPLRPTPETLLKAARREARGKLKIFLGAAPGVGKTFEMLREGAELLAIGRDVVAGIVETHGRSETQSLVAPLEVLPRRIAVQGGQVLGEMDVEALLKRRPQIALVDELAHTNAPGSRHAKRWQDVEDMRDAGIDVLTTLNIQHVESLNDLVASFTHVRVRETVPDAILEDADIEVVDLPPDELIVRLREGKVYVPAEAERALGHFFSRPNLSALRELALRRTAQEVDREMLGHVALTGEPGNWAAAQRIVVALGDQAEADKLVRSARRLADAYKVPWTAITIDTPRTADQNRDARPSLANALRLAAELGAAIVTVSAPTLSEGLRDFLEQSRATVLVVGNSKRRGLIGLRSRSLLDELAQALPEVTLHVVPMARPTSLPGRIALRLNPGHTAAGLGMVALMTLFSNWIRRWIGSDAIDLLYLIPVIITGTAFGIRSSLVTALAAALCYNVFFLAPHGTMTVDDPNNLITLLILAGVGVLASQLVGRLRRQVSIGARIASENAAIANFAQTLSGMTGEQAIAQIICAEIGSLLGANTQLLVLRKGKLEAIASQPPHAKLEPIDLAAADWSASSGEAAGCATGTLSAADWQFHPMRTGGGLQGVLALQRANSDDPVPPDRRILFTTLSSQAAMAMERINLEVEAGKRRVAMPPSAVAS